MEQVHYFEQHFDIEKRVRVVNLKWKQGRNVCFDNDEEREREKSEF